MSMLRLLAPGAGLVLTLFVALIAKPGSSLFSWHPTLATAGHAGLMVMAITALHPENKASYKDKVFVHFACNLAAALLSMAGFAVIFINKDQRGKPHLTTNHGLLGIIVAFLTFFEALGSIVFLYPDVLKKYIGLKNIKTAKMLHRIAAFATFLAAMFELVLGFYSNFWVISVTGLPWVLAVLLVVVITVFTSMQVVPSITAKA